MCDCYPVAVQLTSHNGVTEQGTVFIEDFQERYTAHTGKFVALQRWSLWTCWDAEDAVLVFKDAVCDCTALSVPSQEQIFDYKLMNWTLRGALPGWHPRPAPWHCSEEKLYIYIQTLSGIEEGPQPEEHPDPAAPSAAPLGRVQQDGAGSPPSPHLMPTDPPGFAPPHLDGSAEHGGHEPHGHGEGLCLHRRAGALCRAAAGSLQRGCHELHHLPAESAGRAVRRGDPQDAPRRLPLPSQSRVLVTSCCLCICLNFSNPSLSLAQFCTNPSCFPVVANHLDLPSQTHPSSLATTLPG